METKLSQQIADKTQGQDIYNKIYLEKKLSIEELAIVFNSLVECKASEDELCSRCKTPMSMYCRHEICTPLVSEDEACPKCGGRMSRTNSPDCCGNLQSAKICNDCFKVVLDAQPETDIEIALQVIEQYQKSGFNVEKWTGKEFVITTRFYEYLTQQKEGE